MEAPGTRTEITPKELKKRLDAGEKVVLLDIREPHELAICTLANTAHIPMGDLMERLSELEKYRSQDIVVYCRSGNRSDSCAEFLRDQGFSGLNLTGGILAWSDQIDSSIRKY
jgi:sulfur-carrier protein adenylyltransferase/sulfurtransferase